MTKIRPQVKQFQKFVRVTCMSRSVWTPPRQNIRPPHKNVLLLSCPLIDRQLSQFCEAIFNTTHSPESQDISHTHKITHQRDATTASPNLLRHVLVQRSTTVLRVQKRTGKHPRIHDQQRVCGHDVTSTDFSFRPLHSSGCQHASSFPQRFLRREQRGASM